jgi:hypothetical protein
MKSLHRENEVEILVLCGAIDQSFLELQAAVLGQFSPYSILAARREVEMTGIDSRQ